jgi:hypothetical protein
VPRRKTWNIEERSNGTWVVQREGSMRADSVHVTKEAAVSRAISLCRLNRGDLHVKNRDGDIYDARSYGHVYILQHAPTRDARRRRTPARDEPPAGSMRSAR